MPIYEFTCRVCNAKFDKLLRMADAEQAVCPTCGSEQTARSLSVFAVGSETARQPAAAATGCGRCGGPGPCGMD